MVITFHQMLGLVADVPYQKGAVRISEFYWSLSETNRMLMNTNAHIFFGTALERTTTLFLLPCGEETWPEWLRKLAQLMMQT